MGTVLLVVVIIIGIIVTNIGLAGQMHENLDQAKKKRDKRRKNQSK